ncbi:MAG: hypothetical protein GY719_03750 [bacterium]|nr:hypothetical protein [bacterium]
MNRTLATSLILLGLTLIASSASAQSAEALRDRDGFSLEIAAAVVGIDEFEVNQEAIGLIPRWCWDRNNRREWCWWIDIWWINGPWPDPWRGFLLVDDIPVPVGDLDVGPGWMIAPAIEYRFQPENRLSPSLYLGVGAQYDEGATTEIAGIGQFTTTSTTSPVAIFGGALTYDLSDRTSLRVAAGGSLVFMGDMDIRGPGANFNVDGGETLSGIVSVGLEFGF